MFTKKSLSIILGFFVVGALIPASVYFLELNQEQLGFLAYGINFDVVVGSLVPVSVLGWLVMGPAPPEHLELLVIFSNGIFWAFVGVSVVLSQPVIGFKKFFIPLGFYVALSATFSYLFFCWFEGC